ncbi:hypothetical protein CHARACLAT_020653 [Characodon lateralis]|uniref:Uncharacterized protein n=1 Tax=Characodon lateralis TaxID=208331 RepID=A0ABU7EBV2_9TELE|nr:hypothetical protein [Characodon lateralis]
MTGDQNPKADRVKLLSLLGWVTVANNTRTGPAERCCWQESLAAKETQRQKIQTLIQSVYEKCSYLRLIKPNLTDGELKSRVMWFVYISSWTLEVLFGPTTNFFSEKTEDLK